jgi:hypothetical protein
VADDRPGPGPKEVATTKVPYLGEYLDRSIDVDGLKLVIRVWPRLWLTVLSPTCELDKRDANDSRLMLAPIVFRPMWDGRHWDQIRDGSALNYAYLPPLTELEHKEKEYEAKGWPAGVEAAAVLGSGTLLSLGMLGSPRFGMTAAMRSVFQQRLVLWQSVRDWKRASQFKQLIGKRIADVMETGEKHPAPGVLFKIALENDTDDEATVGLVLLPR